MRLGGAILASAFRLAPRSSLAPRENVTALFLCVQQQRRLDSQPSASITSKAYRGEVIKPPPFPYRKKKYSSWRAWIDKTSPRMDENSKMIVVDGPPACGKSEVAKGIAKELDFLYVPEATLDMIYFTEVGYDLRQLDPKIPPMARSYAIPDFNKNPFDDRAGRMQMMMYHVRYYQYVDALAHILNTGQGVVMDRSIYSDRVFLEAMTKNGYVTKNFRKAYGEMEHTTMRELKRPHLVVYLDLPVPEVQKRIKARNQPHEVNSKALTTQYLKDVEYFYKFDLLKKIEEHAHVLVYDWTDAEGVGDVEGIIEDIERLEFEKHEVNMHDPKMQDWWHPHEDEWCESRYKYTSLKWELLSYFNMESAFLDCPEIWLTGDEYSKLMSVWGEAPGMKYCKGYNTDLGDSVLFKNLPHHRYNMNMWQAREWWIPEK
jgi:NADH dehydrogenase (ubiquinone) 1 alpha subcomplex subunit 10